jgi:hypothetical protein
LEWLLIARKLGIPGKTATDWPGILPGATFFSENLNIGGADEAGFN